VLLSPAVQAEQITFYAGGYWRTYGVPRNTTGSSMA
jgi:hypothetical protein